MIEIKAKILAIILVVFLTSKLVFSQEDYILKNFKIYINIDSRGNIHVIENLTYKFNVESNGVTRSIYIKDPSNIDNLKVYEIYPQKKELQVEVFNKTSSFDFRIYDKFKYETKVLRVEYDLKNFIKFYEDTSEFLLKIFDKNNKNVIENLTIYIFLPEESNFKNIKAYQHGYLYKNIKIKDNRIIYNIGKFPFNTGLELRILLPNNFFYVNDNLKKKLYVYDKFLKEEKNLDIEINKKKSNIKLFNNIGIYSLGIEILLILILYSKLYFNRKYNLPRNYYSKLPNDCTPAVVSCLVKYKKINLKDMIITLVDLVRKKYISIEIINNKKDYKFEIIKENIDELKNHEKHLINWIFYSIGHGKIIYLSEIKRYNQSRQNFNKFKKYYSIWKNKVIEECELYGYFIKNKIFLNYIVIILGLIKLILGSLGLYLCSQYLKMGSIAYILSSAILFLYIITIKRSIIGHIEYKKWKNFKKFLLNFRNKKVINLNNKHIWEKYIVYSFCLNIYKDILYRFKSIIELKECNYLKLIDNKEFVNSIIEAFKLNDLNGKIFKNK
ncbi:DUF2207 domain-containing protein [Tepidibacter thalassicus]|uniref:Uncharacterized membrane protein n=1 Tax=Tepidibacter thalassicus DSM 15285 TaxID=1123350 RepID=A0A1M5NYJ5_9FIRM|nr:DUF2207 domain-containing protein [Tepidibacter thalassicus]SHG94053.1 Uncharacterized membrane protein [Tepidibacter thalassicus DSM 15285]